MATYALATDATLKEVVAYMAMDHDPLNDLDGTAATYKKVMRKWFHAEGASADSTPEELTALCDKWYEETRETWVGYTEFYQPDVSALATGTKGGDNADLTCTPSTDTVEGQDDYAGLPLFACVDVNWTVDEETLEPMITAIDGITSNFKRKDPDVYVGVMRMSYYRFWQENDDTYICGYSAYRDISYTNIEPVSAAVKQDGTVREWIVRPKYASGYGELTCCSGVPVGAFWSHNTIHTASDAIGTQYSGLTADDVAEPIWDCYIKYGSLAMDDYMKGCCSMNYEYYAQAAEEGVKRVILTTANAANLEVGMNVLIGTYDSSQSSPTDRGTSTVYSITGKEGAKITAIETITVTDDDETETEYAAVYVDTDDTFDTAANGSATDGTTMIASFHWDTGMTDSVPGNDGSPTSNTSGKYPFKIQGVEVMCGAYEVVADTILKLGVNDDGTNYFEPYVVKASANQATSITDNYESVGLTYQKTELSAAAWTYIKKMQYADGVMFAEETGGSSSTYTKDGLYEPADVTADTTREWLVRGTLNDPSHDGLSCSNCCNSLSGANWNCGARLSPNGNRGEWTA